MFTKNLSFFALDILILFSLSICSLRNHQSRFKQIPPSPKLEDYEAILALGASEIYATNSPFPYIYIDNFFPDELVRDVLSEFPIYATGDDKPATGWSKSQFNAQNRKLERLFSFDNPPAITFLLNHMLSATFLIFLEHLTGIANLLPDPYLFGAGPHQTLSGGSLSIHRDYNFNDNIGMWRRVNVFLYLNEDWDDSWAGHLELWDANMTSAEILIAPLFNRLVVFTASEISWHGHPQELRCPPNISRKSIALYYYTVDDGYNREKRGTDFRPRENTDNWQLEEALVPVDGKTTLFEK